MCGKDWAGIEGPAPADMTWGVWIRCDTHSNTPCVGTTTNDTRVTFLFLPFGVCVCRRYHTILFLLSFRGTNVSLSYVPFHFSSLSRTFSLLPILLLLLFLTYYYSSFSFIFFPFLLSTLIVNGAHSPPNSTFQLSINKIRVPTFPNYVPILLYHFIFSRLDTPNFAHLLLHIFI